MPLPLSDHPKGAPGSPRAIVNGCICPSEDNHDGEGMYYDIDGPLYMVESSCPVHDNGKDAMAVGWV